MSIYEHYLAVAADLIGSYKGDVPLHHFLKAFFSGHRKYGSRDRKTISTLSYAYFRAGKLFSDKSLEEQIKLALFICSTTSTKLTEALLPEFSEVLFISIQEKLKQLGIDNPASIFLPVSVIFSEGINKDEIALSMFTQPDVFIRVRPDFQQQVTKTLHDIGWHYEKAGDAGIRLEQGLQVDKTLALNGQVVVQDLNSQNVGSCIKTYFEAAAFSPASFWDCCAASGGKTIMLHDLYPTAAIIVSDIRQTILKNLSVRLQEAGIPHYKSFIADLTTGVSLKLKQQPLIIADVPCTGSGTWARTPEQLYFFKEATVKTYTDRQFAIVENVCNYLGPGGFLVYITCSVFWQENEGMIERIIAANGLKHQFSKMLNGTKDKADSLFVAILQKPAKA